MKNKIALFLSFTIAFVIFLCSCDIKCDHEWVCENSTVTCEQAGEITYICSKCNEQKMEQVEALGHDFSNDWTLDVEPTCSKEGIKSHHCSLCDAKKDETPIPLSAHELSVEIDEATCTNEGKKITTCKHCDYKVEETIPTLEHHWNIASPTCTEGQVCTICQAKGASALGHHWNITNPTCTEGQVCTTCQAQGTPALGHHWNIASPTCTEGQVCTNCQAKGDSALGHQFSNAWTLDIEPTCTEAGSKSHHCSMCDAKKDETTLSLSAHELSVEIDEATCFNEGKKITTCKHCDYKVEETIPAIEHHWNIVKEPTCTQSGLEQSECSVSETKTHEKVINPYGHNYISDGDSSYYCIKCGMESSTGTDGSIVIEILSKEGSNNIILGYWNKDNIDFELTVTMIDKKTFKPSETVVPFESFVRENMTITFNMDECKVACESAGFDLSQYDIRINFVPVDSSETDYGITFVSEEMGKFIVPVQGEYEIVRTYFDASLTDEELVHAVIDAGSYFIESKGLSYAKSDDSVFDVCAIYEGTVTSVEEDELWGTRVTIKHVDGIVSIYSSLSNVSLKVNDKVSRGQVIGKASATSLDVDAGVHVHLEIKINNQYVNPTTVLGKDITEIEVNK